MSFAGFARTVGLLADFFPEQENPARFGIADLVSSLVRVGRRLEAPEIRRALARLTDADEIVRALLPVVSAAGVRYVHRDANVEVYVQAWNPGEKCRTAQADGGVSGVLVVRGTATEWYFENTPDGPPRLADIARFAAGSIVVSVHGASGAFGNDATSELVTLHVVSPPRADAPSCARVPGATVTQVS